MRRDSIRPRRIAAVLTLCFLIGCGGGGGDGTKPEDEGPLPLEHFDAGFFSIDRPQGWSVVTAGRCSEFAFLIRDPQDPRWQIFYFGTVGPVYTSQAQKDLDEWYVGQGGFSIPWMDAPVIDPLAPGNYLSHWPEIAEMAAADAFMPDFPHLQGLRLVCTETQTAMLPDAMTANGRGLFTVGTGVVEGLFLATVKEFMPYNGNPGAGTAYGHFICGVTAPKAEFAAVAARLVASLESFTITRAYVDGCIAQHQQVWGAIAAAGRTLSEASDIIYEGWQNRTHGEDILAERWTDQFRNVERVYDPSTGEVYDFPAGWFAAYDPNRNQYDMSSLQLLPSDDWDLWMHSVLDGPSHLH